MKAIEGPTISAIHIPPEDGFSYASFEAVGYEAETVDLKQLVERVLNCFKPSEFSVAIHSDITTKLTAKRCYVEVDGYSREDGCMEELRVGSCVLYQMFYRAADDSISPKSVLKCCWKEEKDEGRN